MSPFVVLVLAVVGVLVIAALVLHLGDIRWQRDLARTELEFWRKVALRHYTPTNGEILLVERQR